MSHKHRHPAKKNLNRLLKKRSGKAGLSPGTLVHIGEEGPGKARVRAVDYDAGTFVETECRSAEEFARFRDTKAVTWIRVDGLSDVEVVKRLGEIFGLHPLVQEDVLNTDQRPKQEDYGTYLYVVLKMLIPDPANGGSFRTEQVSLVLGKGWVISFTERESSLFDQVLVRIRNDQGRHRRMGADYLAYTLMDAVVDQYFSVLEGLGERIEDMEEEVVSRPEPQTLQTIHQLKRDLIFLRRSVWPLREVITAVGRGESGLVEDATRLYLRDVYDHAVQVIDIIEAFRDMTAGMLDIYLSSLSNRMNEVMKVLTLIATIFMPLTVIVGLYGMNFKFMPELEWRWGYPAVLLLMALVAGFMVLFFKRKRWL